MTTGVTKGPVLITTVPFGESDPRSLALMRDAGIDYRINPLGRRLKEDELAKLAGDCVALVAGTEPITERVMAAAPGLRIIARVGIGLDNVDLPAARARGIAVTFTPEAPAPAVAELTIGLMLSLLRGIPRADRSMRAGTWERVSGRRVACQTVGIIGVGRIGRGVIRHLSGFSPRILANDIEPDLSYGEQYGVEWTDKETIYRQADVISLHLPLTPATRGLIGRDQLAVMKRGALLLNTSRGGMVVEPDLADALRRGVIAGAALDVFEHEPYDGELRTLENCVLTCHMGSMSGDCRGRMEVEAVEEVLRFMRGEDLLQPVSDDYE